MTTDARPAGNTGKASPSAITTGLSILTHFLLAVPAIYLTVLSVKTYSVFSWHIICTTFGIGLLMLEAIFFVSGDAYVSTRLKRKTRVLLHWVLQTLGFGLVIAGVVIIIVLKGNRRHFTSDHGKLGLAATIVCALIMINGICTDNTKWFYPRIKPLPIKIFHAVGGIVSMILLIASVINGTYTKWWPGTDIGRELTFASFVIGTILIMVKPILAVVSRSKVVCRKPRSNT